MQFCSSLIRTNPRITDIQNLDVYDIIDGTTSRAQKPTKSKSLAKILLPVPNDISYTDQLNWSSEKVGMLGKVLPTLAGAAVNNPGAMGDIISRMAGAGTPEFILSAIKNIPIEIIM